MPRTRRAVYTSKAEGCSCITFFIGLHVVVRSAVQPNKLVITGCEPLSWCLRLCWVRAAACVAEGCVCLLWLIWISWLVDCNERSQEPEDCHWHRR